MTDQNRTAAETVKAARAIAFYLPQFHPTPENDEWWGKGFTEWTNVAKAKPLYRGHYQPHLPADLGFYDLRIPEVRNAQAAMARAHGIEAFCYWHYWFAGRRILERPFQEVLDSGQPDFPFCLAWANETWTGVWYGESKRILIEQTYPSEDDYRRHFDLLLPAFRDRRYFRVDNKPLMFIYRPQLVPDSRKFIDLWRRLADKAGLPGLFFVGFSTNTAWDGKACGYDGVTMQTMVNLFGRSRHGFGPRFCKLMDRTRVFKRLGPKFYRGPENVYKYANAVPLLLNQYKTSDEYYPTVIPNWDNTPRSGSRGFVLHGSTPELFRKHLRDAIQQVSSLQPDHRLIFIKAWNEWAEGNYLEPDQQYGHGYLQVVKDELIREKTS